jgi:hypothetical protein
MRLMLRRLLAIVVLLPLATGCAAGVVPSATVTTAVQGWENWLRLDWAAQPQPSGQLIEGYVYSAYGSPLYDVRLLAQALDGSGAVVGQKIVWVPGIVPALQGAYFRVAAMPAADRYRVTVWSFDTVQSMSWQ